MVIHAKWSSSQEPQGDAIVVHLIGCRGVLDAQAVESVQDRLFALADEASRCDLILEFGNINYISARAVGMLVGLRDRLKAAKRRLTIQRVCAPVHEVLEVLHVDRAFDLHSMACHDPDQTHVEAVSILWPERRALSNSRDVFIVALHGRKAPIPDFLIQPVLKDSIRDRHGPWTS